MDPMPRNHPELKKQPTNQGSEISTVTPFKGTREMVDIYKFGGEFTTEGYVSVLPLGLMGSLKVQLERKKKYNPNQEVRPPQAPSDRGFIIDEKGDIIRGSVWDFEQKGYFGVLVAVRPKNKKAELNFGISLKGKGPQISAILYEDFHSFFRDPDDKETTSGAKMSGQFMKSEEELGRLFMKEEDMPNLVVSVIFKNSQGGVN